MKVPIKFKVGDMVKCINNDCIGNRLTLGKIYAVKGIHISGGDSFIVLNLPKIEGFPMSSFCFLLERFKLISGVSIKKNKRLLI